VRNDRVHHFEIDASSRGRCSRSNAAPRCKPNNDAWNLCARFARVVDGIVMRQRANPSDAVRSLAALQEDVLIAQLFFYGAAVVAVGVVGYYVYQLLNPSASQQAEAVSQILNYTPGPGTPGSGPVQQTLPNPSVFSDQNPLAPWTSPGPPA
jgi:hypothetical protein